MSGSSDALEFLKKKQMSQKIMYSAIFSRSSYCKKLSWQLKKIADALGLLSALRFFFCFLTSSIFSLLISSPFLFLTARTSRFICVLVAILGNYAMTSNCVFLCCRALAETVLAMRAVPASLPSNRCPQDAEIPPPASIPAELQIQIRIPIPVSRLPL